MCTILEKLVEKYIDKPWEWGKFGLSCNPSITSSFIEKHMDKPWDWGMYGLSSNSFECDKYIRKKKEKEKEKKIKNGLNKLNDLVFFHYTGNPYHPIGKRRLEKQYDELMKNAPSSYNLK